MEYVNGRLNTAIQIAVGLITKDNYTREHVRAFGFYWGEGEPEPESFHYMQREAAEILYHRLNKIDGD